MSKPLKIKSADKECNFLNPVAKHAFKFNKAQIFRDKRQYTRKAKHNGSEPFVIPVKSGITKGSDAWRIVH
jgi:hypothetical protein